MSRKHIKNLIPGEVFYTVFLANSVYGIVRKIENLGRDYHAISYVNLTPEQFQKITTGEIVEILNPENTYRYEVCQNTQQFVVYTTKQTKSVLTVE